MTKKTIIGQLEISVTEGKDTSTHIFFDVDEWQKHSLEPGCWVKYTEKEDGSIVIEKVNPCDYCENGVIKRELD